MTLPNAGPYFVGPSIPCTYCGRVIRMYGSRFSNVDDGEWHTCAHAGQRVGPALVDGDFIYYDYQAPHGVGMCTDHINDMLEKHHMEINEFHHTDGWLFKRLDNGDVRIRNEQLRITHTVPSAEWVSILAFLRPPIGSGESHSAAERFHSGAA